MLPTPPAKRLPYCSSFDTKLVSRLSNLFSILFNDFNTTNINNGIPKINTTKINVLMS
jgi:hypothetical protein